MKKKINILCLIFLVFISCNRKENQPKENYINNKKVLDTLNLSETRISSFEINSTIMPQTVDLLLTYSDNQIDTLIGFCNCEKNIKNNTLKIQIRTEFPSLSELEKGNRQATEFQMEVSRQYRFVTFYLKDSIVEETKIFKASTESQFENEKIDSASFKNFVIRINTIDYKIAQNVWGNYEIELADPFGYSANDYNIKGTFHCNNWKIVDFEELPKWTIKGEKYIE